MEDAKAEPRQGAGLKPEAGEKAPRGEANASTRERVLVAVNGGHLSRRVIRAARQMATSLRAEWIALYVETPGHFRLAKPEIERLTGAMTLARELGARTVTLTGHDVASELLRYARANGITKIVVGKPRQGRWPALRPRVADDLVHQSGNIDIYIVTNATSRPQLPEMSAHTRSWMTGYVLSLAVLLGATLLGLLVSPFLDPINIALLLLLAVVLSATTWGLGPSIFTSILGVIILDALFVPPLGLISISTMRDFLTLAAFLVVAFTVSELGARVRAEVAAAQLRERQIAALYALSRDLAFTVSEHDILDSGVRQIDEVFDSETHALIPGADGRLGPGTGIELNETEQNAAQWALEHGERAGAGTSSFSQAALTYIPLCTSQTTFGVLALRRQPGSVLTPDQSRLLDTFGGQIAMALEHARLRTQAEQAQVLEASERFRNALLSSISHDLRTPLASIMGSATSLLDQQARLEPAARQDLLLTIQEEAGRLNRLVSNLLNMTRVESRALHPHLELHSVEDLVGSTLAHPETTGREVRLALESDLPMVPFDFVLMEQVLLNLLDNACKFSSPGTPVEIAAQREPSHLCVTVSDRGRGIPSTALEKVFDKFYRVPDNGIIPGSGLGLSICKGIVEAHGGCIWATAREGGGTRITFTLPLEGKIA